MADRAQFDTLADQWESETAVFSMAYQRTEHPAFGRILTMGKQAIPWAVERLREDVLWYLVLERLVDNPPLTNAQGDMGRLQDAWLKWARDNGHG